MPQPNQPDDQPDSKSADLIETLILIALPASGKSEVRRYLASLSPHQCRDDFGIGPTLQLDDFPYVHLMRRIDEERWAAGASRIFFSAADQPFFDAREWGTLIELLNEDFDDLHARRTCVPACAAAWLLERIDAAAARVGIAPRLGALGPSTVAALACKLEAEAAAMLAEKHASYPDTLAGKTVVIEFARGAAVDAAMPLAPPFGYAYSLAQLSPRVLETARVLYIEVSPEESRRKNCDRADPHEPGSVLHHGTPLPVMLHDYGCDDIAWLRASAAAPDTLPVHAHGRRYDLPVACLDNRIDKTSFVRQPREQWPTAAVATLHAGLRVALDAMRPERPAVGSSRVSSAA